MMRKLENAKMRRVLVLDAEKMPLILKTDYIVPTDKNAHKRNASDQN